MAVQVTRKKSLQRAKIFRKPAREFRVHADGLQLFVHVFVGEIVVAFVLLAEVHLARAPDRLLPPLVDFTGQRRVGAGLDRLNHGLQDVDVGRVQVHQRIAIDRHQRRAPPTRRP